MISDLWFSLPHWLRVVLLVGAMSAVAIAVVYGPEHVIKRGNDD